MKACIYEEYGPAEVVTVGEVPTPTPSANEILVRVHAAAVTTADWRFRASSFPGGFWLAGRLLLGLFRPRHPTLGRDYAGVVVAVGRDVTCFRVGDAVFGATSRGAHAEFVAVKESGSIALKPASLSYEEAAAIPFGGNSALMFMRDFGKVKPGQRVLVIGASGGVGSWAVQIARHFGAEVTGACSTRNIELVRSLGAHHVVDYTAGSPFGEGTYDLVFDTVGVTTFAGTKHALTAKGTYLPLEGSLGTMAQAVFTALGAGKKVKHAISKNTRQGLEELSGLIESGVLRPVVDTAVPMARIADAYRLVESRHKRGSVIVTMHAPPPAPTEDRAPSPARGCASERNERIGTPTEPGTNGSSAHAGGSRPGFLVVTSPAVSADPRYGGDAQHPALDAADVEVTNLDHPN